MPGWRRWRSRGLRQTEEAAQRLQCEGRPEALPDRQARVPRPAGRHGEPGEGRPDERPSPATWGRARPGPNDRLQANLIDFFQNTSSAKKYGLMVTDVFTREAVTRALPNKNAETVARAAAEAIPDLVQDEGTTDEGNEFRTLEANRNATSSSSSSSSSAIQTLKKDLGQVAQPASGATTWPTLWRPTTRSQEAQPVLPLRRGPVVVAAGLKGAILWWLQDGFAGSW